MSVPEFGFRGKFHLFWAYFYACLGLIAGTDSIRGFEYGLLQEKTSRIRCISSNILLGPNKEKVLG